jgi:hypothetical protein
VKQKNDLVVAMFQAQKKKNLMAIKFLNEKKTTRWQLGFLK